MSKLSWKTVFPVCCGKTADESLTLPSRKPLVYPSSPQRLSFCDLSNSTPPLSPKVLSSTIIGSMLHVFTFTELKAMTRNFSRRNLIGEGGFGSVHKGFIEDKMRPGLKEQPVAVKSLDQEGWQGHNEWLAEVILLGQLTHPNLVKLIGYCWEDEHRMLVYEFMPRGCLDKRLFNRLLAPLPWSVRLKIAIGAAKGLAYLHDIEKPVIYRDFKASNILLDPDYMAKLSDLGLAMDGPEGDDTDIRVRVMGTHGYAAPEYITSGNLNKKSDVYSFGVVLLEILTGRRSIDRRRPIKEQNLVVWARPYLTKPERLSFIMDPRLEGKYSSIGAQKAAMVAYRCLSQNPRSRPPMRTVVENLEPLLDLNDVPVGLTEAAVFGKADGSAKVGTMPVATAQVNHQLHDQRRAMITKYSDQLPTSNYTGVGTVYTGRDPSHSTLNVARSSQLKLAPLCV